MSKKICQKKNLKKLNQPSLPSPKKTPKYKGLYSKSSSKKTGKEMFLEEYVMNQNS